MDITKVQQIGESSLFDENVTYDSENNEIIIPACTYNFFGTDIVLSETRFTLAANDQIYITESGLIKLHQKPAPDDPNEEDVPDYDSYDDHDFTQYDIANLFGYEFGDVFYYVVFT